MKIKRYWLGALTAALLLPASVSGQSLEGEWSVDVIGGAQMYPETSSLTTGPFVGVQALYQLTPRIAVGPAVDFVRTETDGSWFIAAVDFGADSTRIFEVGQRISALHYSGQVRFELSPEADFNPYLIGGAGGYTLYLETQSNDGFNRISELMFQVGAGIRYAVNESAGIQLDLRDVIYTNFERAPLNPIRERERNRQADGTIRFPGAERSDYDDADEMLHNLRFSIGLTYIPGLNR